MGQLISDLMGPAGSGETCYFADKAWAVTYG